MEMTLPAIAAATGITLFFGLLIAMMGVQLLKDIKDLRK